MMHDTLKIAVISGSTRASSSNANLIHAITKFAAGTFEINVYTGISALPHFNPDLDMDPEQAAPEVAELRQFLRAADGILICTPEYAMGVPGTLKNALDWTVSSMEFSHKPVALITASLSGVHAHISLLGTLLILEARLTARTQLLVPAVQTKVNAEAQITDPGTAESITQLLESLGHLIRQAANSLGNEPLLQAVDYLQQ
jgi:chromate reductase